MKRYKTKPLKSKEERKVLCEHHTHHRTCLVRIFKKTFPLQQQALTLSPPRNSDLQILLSLTPDNFTRQRETPWW